MKIKYQCTKIKMENIELLFWEKLSEAIKAYCSQSDYKNNKTLTEKMKNISDFVIYKFLEENNYRHIDYDPWVSNEDYRVDVVGFYTAYWKNQQKPSKERQSEWTLEIALEHENKHDWDKELCKLCYLCANLKVIISYYKNDIKKVLNERLRKLGKEKIFIYPKSKWLFVFGPSGKKNYGKPFMAFYIDKTLTSHEAKISEPIIPEQLKEKTHPLPFPKNALKIGMPKEIR